jgi:hypothetical protein
LKENVAASIFMVEDNAKQQASMNGKDRTLKKKLVL